MIIDVTAGSGNTEREIGYVADIFLDSDKRKVDALIAKGRRAIVGDFTNLPFPDNCADEVVFDHPYSTGPSGSGLTDRYGKYRNQAEMIKSISKAFLEIRRVLKPNGICLFKWGSGCFENHTAEWVMFHCLPRDMGWQVLITRRSPSAKYHVSLVYWIEIWHSNVTGLGKEGMEAFVNSLSHVEKEQLWTKKSS